jgi:hypothetical protein
MTSHKHGDATLVESNPDLALGEADVGSRLNNGHGAIRASNVMERRRLLYAQKQA